MEVQDFSGKLLSPRDFAWLQASIPQALRGWCLWRWRFPARCRHWSRRCWRSTRRSPSWRRGKGGNTSSTTHTHTHELWPLLTLKLLKNELWGVVVHFTTSSATDAATKCLTSVSLLGGVCGGRGGGAFWSVTFEISPLLYLYVHEILRRLLFTSPINTLF